MKILNFNITSHEVSGHCNLDYNDFIKCITVVGLGKQNKLNQLQENILIQIIVRMVQCGYNIQLKHFPKNENHKNFFKKVRHGRTNTKYKYTEECI